MTLMKSGCESEGVRLPAGRSFPCN